MKRTILLICGVLIVLLFSSCNQPASSQLYDSNSKCAINNDTTAINTCPKNNTTAINTYPKNNEVSSVIVPEEIDGKQVTILGQDAFYQHENLVSVTLPESLTTIEGSPFYRCYSLKKMHIPRNVKQIDSNPFFRCTALTEITVDSNNECFVADDGILFNKEKTQLIAYPEGKTDESYTVPKSVKKLEVDAFGYHPKLKKIIILSNVEYFPDENMFVFPDDITLYVESNSAAEQYAKIHNLHFEVI